MRLNLTLTRQAPPQTHLRQETARLMETLLGQLKLPAALRVVPQSYLRQVNDQQLNEIVDALEQVVVGLRDAQRIDKEEAQCSAGSPS